MHEIEQSPDGSNQQMYDPLPLQDLQLIHPARFLIPKTGCSRMPTDPVRSGTSNPTSCPNTKHMLLAFEHHVNMVEERGLGHRRTPPVGRFRADAVQPGPRSSPKRHWHFNKFNTLVEHEVPKAASHGVRNQK